MGRPGKREFVRVLRLLETFPADEVHAAVQDAISRGATGYDAVKHLLLCRFEGRPPRLDLDLHPHLPSVSVSTTSAQDYMKLLGEKRIVSDRPTLLLEHHLKELKLPTFLREYGKIAAQCASEGVDYPAYLLRLSELELIDRHHRLVARRIKAARFPAVKSLDAFDFPAIPSVNRQLVTQLARCEYIERRENVIAIGNSGTGKTHIALGLGLAGCQKGLSVGFTTASALVNELMEARDEMRLLLPAEEACATQAADHRRARLRAAVQDRGGTALRGLQPALRAWIGPRDHQPAVRSSGPRCSGQRG